MARRIDIGRTTSLEEYEAVAHLVPAVLELRREAASLRPRLDGRTVWMINSTPQGGGVAEMLPGLIGLLRDVGVSAEWVVLETDDQAFFGFTKRLHNLIHGEGEPDATREERERFEAVNRENAEQLASWMKPQDLLVVHDPQPLPLAGMLGAGRYAAAIWRCHIGLDRETPQSSFAWEFLEPYTREYAHSIFSAPEYIPEYLRTRSSVIHPAIDPLSAKNHELKLHKLVGVLVNGALARLGPVLTPPYTQGVERLSPDGSFRPACAEDDVGLLTRPIVTQISRWDRLKGWAPLLSAFAKLKGSIGNGNGRTAAQRRRTELVRLVLGGPDPASIADDPEGLQVIEELRARYLALPSSVQRDVALLTLPMRDLRQNALLVNAIQRASSVVVQNSIREGFGLTVTEAMWKQVPVLSNAQACGPRHQVRNRLDGLMVTDPEDETALAEALDEMLSDPGARQAWGQSAQRRVHDEFLVFTQVRRWLETLAGAL